MIGSISGFFVKSVFHFMTMLTGTFLLNGNKTVSLLTMLFIGFARNYTVLKGQGRKGLSLTKAAAMKFCIGYSLESWFILFWMGLEKFFFAVVLPLLTVFSGFQKTDYCAENGKLVLFHNFIGARTGILTLAYRLLCWDRNSAVFLDENMMAALSGSLVRLGALSKDADHLKKFTLTARALSSFSPGLKRSKAEVVLLNGSDPYNLITACHLMKSGYHLVSIPEASGNHGLATGLQCRNGKLMVPSGLSRVLPKAGSVLSLLPAYRYIFPSFTVQAEYPVKKESTYGKILQDCADRYWKAVNSHPHRFVPLSHTDMWKFRKRADVKNTRMELWKDANGSFMIDGKGGIMLMEF